MEAKDLSRQKVILIEKESSEMKKKSRTVKELLDAYRMQHTEYNLYCRIDFCCFLNLPDDKRQESILPEPPKV